MAASLGGLFCFPAFSRIGFASFETLFPCRSEEGKSLGVKGELTGPRLGEGRLLGGRREQEAWMDPHAGPDPHRGCLLPASSLCNPK